MIDLLEGELAARIIDDLRVSVVRLTFDRARLIVGSVNDRGSYDDGW